jgi:hypothetical protein
MTLIFALGFPETLPLNPGVLRVAGQPVEPDPAAVPDGLEAEDQAVTGKFLTATEVRPILEATKGSWVAVREFDGRDLVYVTHLWAWRCGLAAIAVSINDGPFQDWPLPPCRADTPTPNAVLESDGLPYREFELGSVESVGVQVVYDDLTLDALRFPRSEVQIP